MGPVICFCWWLWGFVWTSVKLELKQQVFLACNPAGLIFESRTMVDCSRHMCVFCFVLLSLGSTCTVFFWGSKGCCLARVLWFFVHTNRCQHSWCPSPLSWCHYRLLLVLVLDVKSTVSSRTMLIWAHCIRRFVFMLSYEVMKAPPQIAEEEKLNGTITIMATLQLFD